MSKTGKIFKKKKKNDNSIYHYKDEVDYCSK